jgi:hypothetical protein
MQNLLKEKTCEIETMRRAAKRDAQEIQRLGHVIEKADSARRRQVGLKPVHVRYVLNNTFQPNHVPEQEEDQRRTRDMLQRQRSLSNNASQSGLLMTASSPRPGMSTSQLRGYTEVEKKTKKWLDVKIREVRLPPSFLPPPP